MTNAEYLEIFQSEQLIRSPAVRLLEEQIRILIRLSKVFLKANETDLSIYCDRVAEETKWESISLAEYEKDHGVIFLNLGGWKNEEGI